MKNIIISILIILLSFSAYSQEWVSPIDEKYSSRSPEIFSNFSKAREILNSYRGQGEKLREADAILRQVIQEDRTFAPAYREYGRLFIMAGHIVSDDFKKGSLGPAESAILKSIEIEPQYADSYVLLGHLYTKMKRYSEAKAALEESERIGTEIPWLHLNWADLHKKLGNYKEALKRYQYVVNKGTPNRKAYSNALNGIPTMYWYMDEYDKANDGYKQLLEFEPGSAWNWGYYSYFLLYSYDDVDGAIMNGEKALSIMDYGLGRFTLASALYTKWAKLLNDPVKKSEASQYFDQAWSLYPYPEKIIEETKKHKYTEVAAIELKKWLTKQSTRTQ